MNEPATWISNLTDLLKFVVLPFGAVGGWAGIRWAMERYGAHGTVAEQAQKRADSEREKTLASLDSRQAALMDRVERSESKATALLDHVRDEAKREISTLQLERDVVWFVILEQEQDMVVRREAHIMTIGNYNGLVSLLKRLADGHVTIESVQEQPTLRPEENPPRIMDLRIKIRDKTIELKKLDVPP